MEHPVEFILGFLFGFLSAAYSLHRKFRVVVNTRILKPIWVWLRKPPSWKANKPKTDDSDKGAGI